VSSTACAKLVSRKDQKPSSKVVLLGKSVSMNSYRLVPCTAHPRVVRSSPQFATTLAVYEMLHKHFPYPFAEPTPAVHRAARQTTDISRIRARNALRILLDCSSRFGMVDQKAASQGVQSLPKLLRS
jgi:hypothetical protein